MGSEGNAVAVKAANKVYGKGHKRVLVLDNMDMAVPKGGIYGLLGPSGCGKTTLLGTLVNRVSLDSGEVQVFGFNPGSPEAGIPGRRVGYMPQELALHSELTISETLMFYGRIHHLSLSQVKEKSAFLVKFLDLPNPSRLTEQLSGGQKRRVSLAAALLHEPQLLILDEPTVGVDPLLRTSIWQHLVEVCKSQNTTIILTTHYIEEAKLASRVGLMRQGRLLAEAAPSSLNRYFQNPSLENIFLRLCLQEGDADQQGGRDNQGFETIASVELGNVNMNYLPPQKTNEQQNGNLGIVVEKNPLTGYNTIRDFTNFEVCKIPEQEVPKFESFFCWCRFVALLSNNSIRMKRNKTFLFFSFLLPLIQTVLFCVTIGGAPLDLPVGFVNLDEGRPSRILNSTLYFSHDYLTHINNKTIQKHFYPNYETAVADVRLGNLWAVVVFGKNFTNALRDQALQLGLMEPEEAKIRVYLDNSNQQISWAIQMDLIMAQKDFLNQYASFIPGFDPTLPVVIEQPIYGEEHPTFMHFMAPGIILTITYFFAMALTSLAFITERKEGLYNRAKVAGIQSMEIMAAHLVTQTMVLVGQITLILVFMFIVFNIPCVGNIMWVILISFLQGICGMCFGLMISASTNEEVTSFQLSIGTFYPTLLLSGILWPVEGIPLVLRYITYALPQTYACESVRAVLFKGWDITYFDVWLGFAITIIWAFIYLFMTVVLLRIRK